jgi:hypothetical protein
MPADSTHNDPGTSSNTDAGIAAAGSEHAPSSPSTSFPPSRSHIPQHGTSRTNSLSGRVDQSSADVAYAPIPFLGLGADSYDSQAARASTALGGHQGHPTTSPASLTIATNQPAVVSYSSDWDNSFGNFLDLVHAYEPQGVLAQEAPEQLHEFNLPQTLSTPPTSSLQPPNLLSSDTVKLGSSASRVPAQPPALRTALKRKADASEPNSAESDRSKAKPSDWPSGRNRTVSFGRMSKPSPSPSAEGATNAENLAEAQVRRPGTLGVNRQKSSDNGGLLRTTITSQASGNQGAGRPPGIVRGKSQASTPSILPAEKVFPIQIGSELFRLSGASIASDGLYSLLIF